MILLIQFFTVPVCKGGREISGGKLLRGIGAPFACGSCDSSGCLFHNMKVHTGGKPFGPPGPMKIWKGKLFDGIGKPVNLAKVLHHMFLYPMFLYITYPSFKIVVISSGVESRLVESGWPLACAC